MGSCLPDQLPQKFPGFSPSHPSAVSLIQAIKFHHPFSSHGGSFLAFSNDTPYTHTRQPLIGLFSSSSLLFNLQLILNSTAKWFLLKYIFLYIIDLSTFSRTPFPNGIKFKLLILSFDRFTEFDLIFLIMSPPIPWTNLTDSLPYEQDPFSFISFSSKISPLPPSPCIWILPMSRPCKVVASFWVPSRPDNLQWSRLPLWSTKALTTQLTFNLYCLYHFHL